MVLSPDVLPSLVMVHSHPCLPPQPSTPPPPPAPSPVTPSLAAAALLPYCSTATFAVSATRPFLSCLTDEGECGGKETEEEDVGAAGHAGGLVREECREYELGRLVGGGHRQEDHRHDHDAKQVPEYGNTLQPTDHLDS